VGIVTSRDGFVIADDLITLENRIKSFFIDSKEELLKTYDLRENKSWKIDDVKASAKEFEQHDIRKVNYRPFDNRFLYYNNVFIERNRSEVMQHFVKGDNVGLIIGRQGQVVGSMPWNLSFITNSITDFNLYYRGGGSTFPLYIYPETTTQQTTVTQPERVSNFDMVIIKEFEERTGLYFRGEDIYPDATIETNTFSPEELLHYIYAVLHSPTFREKYKEFLKIDFPRVPFPKDPKTFYDLEDLGRQLKELHLLESATVEDYITTYPKDGSNMITKPIFEPSLRGGTTKQSHESDASTPTLGKVYINETQYFDNIPLVAWEFYIGGYQPAQKWLKDRKGRTLGYDDILHYQKIIVALAETDRLMREIDGVEIE
jgi:predicted helicase